MSLTPVKTCGLTTMKNYIFLILELPVPTVDDSQRWALDILRWS